MITGFNTDIEHGGVTYHVQTEDKGLETPLILSLVYVGGAILASKRTPYDDLVTTGFDEKTLSERLQRQHKLLCAAIRAGRVDDLKRMGERDHEAAASARREETAAANGEERKLPPHLTGEPANGGAEPVAPPAPPPFLDLITDFVTPIFPEDIKSPTPPSFGVGQEPMPIDADASPPPAPDAAEDAVPVEVFDEEADELYLKLLDDEGEFRAGQLATIKIYVGRGRFGRQSVAEATVTVKVLGTTFRPLILNTRTAEDGVAVVRALLPQFNSGRAALLIRAADSHGGEAELRRIIHHA